MRIQRFPNLSPLLLLSLLSGCSAGGTDAGETAGYQAKSQALTEAEVLLHRSLAVTEVEITERFELEAVLAQLLTQADASGQTPSSLFEDWVGIQSDCDDVNGFPMVCSTNEAGDSEPFPPSSFQYHAVGLFNRFDLAPADGADCGEYRIVFARQHSDFGQEKTLIFESRLPNPSPELGLAGCRPIAEFWAELSDVTSLQERGDLLHDFYFQGISGFPPAIHVDHFRREAGSGQIRTNSFLSITEWNLREFGLDVSCGANCELSFVANPTDENPFIELSVDGSSDPRSQAFQDWFIAELAPGEGLLTDDLNTMTFPVPEEFNGGQSRLPESRAFPLVVPNLSDNAGPDFITRLEAELDSLGSPLSAKQVLDRANSMTCNGCHSSSVGDDLGFESNFADIDRFRHVKLTLDTTDAPDGPRHLMSDALKTEFLPFRRQNLVDFLNETAPAEELTAELSVASSWGSGYCANVSVTNTTSAPTSWSVDLELSGASLSTAWNATTSVAGSLLNATPPSWQGALAAGGTASFGFCVSHGAGVPLAEVVGVEAQ